MAEHAEIRILFLLVALSVAVPLVVTRLRIPAAVGLILAGIAFGPTGLGWVHETSAVSLLAELGFLVLMFIAGMEIDFTALRFAGSRALLRPTLIVIGFFAIAAVSVSALSLTTLDLLVISATSVGMPLAVLQETGQSRTDFGRHVILVASIGEFLSILAIVIYELSAMHGTTWHAVWQVTKVLALFGGSAILIRLARAVVWWYPERFRRMVEHHDAAELGVRGGLLVMFGFVVLAGLAGVEPILGAFIAGALVAFVLREKHALEVKVSALGHGLFIPLFLVVVGLRFDLRLLDGEAVVSALLLTALAGLSKLAPALLIGARGLGLGQRVASGALLAAPLTLVVAIGAIGQRLGVIDARQGTTLVLVALLLSVLFPVAFLLLSSPVGLGPPSARLPAEALGLATRRQEPTPEPSGDSER